MPPPFAGKSDADTILEQELETINKIHKDYPSLRQVPIMNDEADFLVGWSRGHEWRAKDSYAALVARSVYIHQRARIRKPQLNFDLMSFDNAFLSYNPFFFHQRTLLARFQINSTIPHQVQMIKKPSYSIMSLLSLLGNQSLAYTSSLEDKRISVLATCRFCALNISTQETSRMKVLQITEDRIYENFIDIESGEGEYTTHIPSDFEDQHENLIPHQSVERDLNLIYQDPNNVKDTLRSIGSLHSRSEALPQNALPNSSGTVSHLSSSEESWEATLLISLSNGTEGSQRLGPTLLANVTQVVKFVGSLVMPEVIMIHLCYPTSASPGEVVCSTLIIFSYYKCFHCANCSEVFARCLLYLTALSVYVCLFFNRESWLTHMNAFIKVEYQVIEVTTLAVSDNDVLITWSDAQIVTRCVWYYEVQRSPTGKEGSYTTISNSNVTDNNFMYSLTYLPENGSVAGWYRVRVMTYWGTSGPFSAPVKHTL
ncbi:hypothetical protein SK128_013365 [Halocaridina rubra]|uniref:Uncharacterized protein n=1 Tax=Halocaridina rubra TaxID=373956 RepID=A0AAN8X2V6_HALRR